MKKVGKDGTITVKVFSLHVLRFFLVQFQIFRVYANFVLDQ